MPIEILSDEIVNQIAAGEVVERPSHLVKELLENSLDAGAKNIEIDFNEGGRSVRVWDDGHGMGPRDLELSIARHATSKIRTAEDLWRLHTFGFRGEALASIASVSRMQLKSRDASGAGAAMAIEFGRTTGKTDYEGDQGTRIEISDLFGNVPARLKFLKSVTAESSAIKNLVKAIGMSRSDVNFRLLTNGSLQFYWPATDGLQSRVEQVLERKPLFKGSATVDSFSAEVVVASPSEVVQQNRQIWIFVNGRFVQDRNLQFAVLEAYRTFLMHGEYPIAAVFLRCPSSEVDVNVHPTKSQVKFRNQAIAFRVVHQAVRGILESAPWLENSMPVPPAAVITPPSTPLSFAADDFSRHQTRKVSAFSALQKPIRIEETNVSSHFKWADLMLIGQAHLTYIMAQSDAGLLLIDQHAAHERVLFERLYSQWKAGQIEVQSLLIPMMIELDETQVEAMRPHFETLRSMGMDVSEMGPATLAVRSIPALISEDSLYSALQKFAANVEQSGGSFAMEKAVSDIFATMACHSAIRAGKTLSPEEMTSLLEQMDEFRSSSFCPHGRPVSVELSLIELEKRFGRIN